MSPKHKVNLKNAIHLKRVFAYRYKLCYYRFGELTTEYGKPTGYVKYLFAFCILEINAFTLHVKIKLRGEILAGMIEQEGWR